MDDDGALNSMDILRGKLRELRSPFATRVIITGSARCCVSGPQLSGEFANILSENPGAQFIIVTHEHEPVQVDYCVYTGQNYDGGHKCRHRRDSGAATTYSSHCGVYDTILLEDWLDIGDNRLFFETRPESFPRGNSYYAIKSAQLERFSRKKTFIKRCFMQFWAEYIEDSATDAPHSTTTEIEPVDNIAATTPDDDSGDIFGETEYSRCDTDPERDIETPPPQDDDEPMDPVEVVMPQYWKLVMALNIARFISDWEQGAVKVKRISGSREYIEIGIPSLYGAFIEWLTARNKKASPGFDLAEFQASVRVAFGNTGEVSQDARNQSQRIYPHGLRRILARQIGEVDRILSEDFSLYENTPFH